MKEKIAKFSLKQKYLNIKCQIWCDAIHSIRNCSEHADTSMLSGESMLPNPSVSELADDIHTQCWPRLWITHIGILRLKLNTNTQIAPQYIVN